MAQLSHEDHIREVNQLEAESELPLHILLRTYGIETSQSPRESETVYSVTKIRDSTASKNVRSDGASMTKACDACVFAESFAIETRLLDSYETFQGRIQPTKPLPYFPEPTPNKTHWFHALEEMSWLAGDFIRERKWR